MNTTCSCSERDRDLASGNNLFIDSVCTSHEGEALKVKTLNEYYFLPTLVDKYSGLFDSNGCLQIDIKNLKSLNARLKAAYANESKTNQFDDTLFINTNKCFQNCSSSLFSMLIEMPNSLAGIFTANVNELNVKLIGDMVENILDPSETNELYEFLVNEVENVCCHLFQEKIQVKSRPFETKPSWVTRVAYMFSFFQKSFILNRDVFSTSQETSDLNNLVERVMSLSTRFYYYVLKQILSYEQKRISNDRFMCLIKVIRWHKSLKRWQLHSLNIQ